MTRIVSAIKGENPAVGLDEKIKDFQNLVVKPSIYFRGTLPRNTVIYRDTLYDVSTEKHTQVRITLEEENLIISFGPYLLIDVIGPFNNRIIAISYRYGNNSVNVTTSGQWSSYVDKGINELVFDKLRLFENTPLNSPSYNPFKDNEVKKTVTQLLTNIKSNIPADGNSNEEDISEKIDTIKIALSGSIKEEIIFNVSSEITLALSKGFWIKIEISSDDSLKKITTDWPRISITSVNFESAGILIRQNNKDILKLNSFTFWNGGGITLIDYQVLIQAINTAATIERATRLIRFISIISSAARSNPLLGYSLSKASPDDVTEPKIIGGITRALIEEQLSNALTNVIKLYRKPIDGLELDLVKSLGIEK